MKARTGALCVAALILCLAPAAAHQLRIPDTTLEPVEYGHLKGWLDDNHVVAFQAFRDSCDAILRREKARADVKPLERALRAPCGRAVHHKEPIDKEAARDGPFAFVAPGRRMRSSGGRR